MSMGLFGNKNAAGPHKKKSAVLAGLKANAIVSGAGFAGGALGGGIGRAVVMNSMAKSAGVSKAFGKSLVKEGAISGAKRGMKDAALFAGLMGGFAGGSAYKRQKFLNKHPVVNAAVNGIVKVRKATKG